MTKTNSLFLISFTYVCVMTMSACSSTSKLDVIKSGDSVAFVTISDTDKNLPFNISNNGIGEDATTGGLAGAGVGAAAGLFCGPIFFICSPILALTGAVGGGSLGAVVGSVTGLSTEDEANLSSKTTNFINTNQPQTNLLTEVTKQAGKNFTVVDAPYDNQVSIQIQSLQFNSFSDGRIALSLEVAVVVNYLEKPEIGLSHRHQP
ncbi:hypothetical protein [Shewanella aestuarii]|uniref:Glycine zipper family protein n=1 Tax=Shewanella aestuarii TaxID=1028752 RepID=A0A6G9QJU7_9GAMM|nr:hypothetical protein [Shewanella aestuarii]QIR14830.1 hypothetical protein HBH39_10295 [Shewanella aestuarii]